MKYTVSLKENRVFRRLYAKGRSAVSPTMVLYCRKNGRRENRLGLTTGTKLRLSPGYDIVVVARVRAVYSRYAELERDFLRLAKKLQLLSPQGSDAEGEKP